MNIVICKDCKFFISYAELDSEEYAIATGADGVCDLTWLHMHKNGFCNCSERK